MKIAFIFLPSIKVIFLHTFSLGKARFWIGLRREDSGSDWKWTDGDDKFSRYMSRKNFKGEGIL